MRSYRHWAICYKEVGGYEKIVSQHCGHNIATAGDETDWNISLGKANGSFGYFTE
jgi:hypothetical protein